MPFIACGRDTTLISGTDPAEVLDQPSDTRCGPGIPRSTVYGFLCALRSLSFLVRRLPGYTA